MSIDENRRPVSSRKINVFHKLAHSLVKVGLHPNHVSVLSAVFGSVAGISLWQSAKQDSVALSILLLTIALFGIQLRLICNLIDGLMAVEGGLKTPTGEIYNDYPDRISDVAVLIGAGYAASNPFEFAVELGWLAALIAVMTAYTRVLGASMGASHFFSGPMAKQHRMFLMTLVILLSMGERYLGIWGHALVGGLVLIIAGSLITCVNRLSKISKRLNSVN